MGIILGSIGFALLSAGGSWVFCKIYAARQRAQREKHILAMREIFAQKQKELEAKLERMEQIERENLELRNEIKQAKREGKIDEKIQDIRDRFSS